MIDVKRRSGIVISREYENDDFYRNIQKTLFRRYKNFNSEDYTTFRFYSESQGFMTIPRFFPIEKYVNCRIEDNRHTGAPIEIEHNTSASQFANQVVPPLHIIQIAGNITGVHHLLTRLIGKSIKGG